MKSFSIAASRNRAIAAPMSCTRRSCRGPARKHFFFRDPIPEKKRFWKCRGRGGREADSPGHRTHILTLRARRSAPLRTHGPEAGYRHRPVGQRARLRFRWRVVSARRELVGVRGGLGISGTRSAATPKHLFGVATVKLTRPDCDPSRHRLAVDAPTPTPSSTACARRDSPQSRRSLPMRSPSRSCSCSYAT